MKIFSTLLATTFLFATATSVFAAGSDEEKEVSKEAKVYNEGVKLLKMSHYEKAEVKFREALAIKEEFAKAHNNLAFVLRKQGEENYDESLTHYARALELDPKLARAYMYRGSLYALSEKTDLAEADLATLKEMGEEDLAKQLALVIENGKETARYYGFSEVEK